MSEQTLALLTMTRDTLVSLQAIVRILAQEHWSSTMHTRISELNIRIALLTDELNKAHEPPTLPTPSDSPGA